MRLGLELAEIRFKSVFGQISIRASASVFKKQNVRNFFFSRTTIPCWWSMLIKWYRYINHIHV